MSLDSLAAFARNVRRDRRANPAIAGDGTALELLLAPRFQALIEALIAGRPAAPRVLPEYRVGGVGRPDLAFAQPNAPARAFLELKEPGKSLDPSRLRGHDARQFARFRDLPFWAMSNFHAVRLYQRNRELERVQFLPLAALDPETPDAVADRLVRTADLAGLQRVLDMLVVAPQPPMRNARDFAHALAHAARLVREIVAEHCRVGAPAEHAAELARVRAVFREQIFARPEAGGYEVEDLDALFASAYAQTLSFGLLLAREVTGYAAPATRNAYQLLPPELYPLLRGTLRAITQDEMLPLLGIAFDVVQETVNAATAGLLARRADGADPILYFYEDFLEVFDASARNQHGVFFTPVPVVNHIVRATDLALRQDLETDGFLDADVHTLDPACGTGTFLVSAIAEAAARAEAERGSGSVGAEVAAFAGRLHGFELLVGGYTVAQFRLLRELTQRGAGRGVMPSIRLTDTLAPVADQSGVSTPFGFLDIPMVREREAADAVKARTRILAIFGNPPYRRLKRGEVPRLVGAWMDALWDDLKQPVRDAGLGLSLNPFPDLYIAFWRWALWRLFEAPGAGRRGVVAFITNRGFLSGRAFGGLRAMMRRRFDVIRILDLRGDNRGALPVGAEADENVFRIETGVCIVVAVARGPKPDEAAEADVSYADIWQMGGFRRAEKLAALDAADGGASVRWARLPGSGMDRLKPVGFAGRDWPALDQVLSFRSNGIVTYRDDFAYAASAAVLEDRIRTFLRMPPEQAARMFGESTLRRVGPAMSVPFDASRMEQIVYRPLDQRVLYNRREYIDRPRADMQEAWGAANFALFALEDGTGRGPAVWCHGRKPDQHAFRGSYGGWLFPLWHHAAGAGAHYLDPQIIPGLTIAYGTPPDAQDVFDAVLCLLSASSYTTRFAADLEDDFPHIPFPAAREVLDAAARLGAEIRAVQTFARAPGPAFRTARLLGQAGGVTLEAPRPSTFAGVAGGRGAVPLQHDGSLRLGELPEAVWTFEVSGYRVLHKWLSARDGDALDAALTRGILDTAWRIEELLHLFDAADAVLEAAVATPLTRTTLGFSTSPGPDASLSDGHEPRERSPA